MNPLDLGVIAIVVLSAIFAFARGFVREALSIVAWIGAAAATYFGFDWTFAHVEPMVHNPLLSQVIAGFGLFVISLIALTIVTSMIARAVRASALSPIDRTLGFIFGLARGAFLVCLAYLLLDVSVQPNDRPPWIREAKSAPYLREGADVLRGFLPESLKIKNAAVDDVIRAVDPKQIAAEEAKKAMRAYTTPTPAAAPKPEPAGKAESAARPDSKAKPETPPPTPNYSPKDRHDFDRLIGTQR